MLLNHYSINELAKGLCFITECGLSNFALRVYFNFDFYSDDK